MNEQSTIYSDDAYVVVIGGVSRERKISCVNADSFM